MLTNPIVLSAIEEVKDLELTIATLTAPRIVERGKDWKVVLPPGTRYITNHEFEFKNKQLTYGVVRPSGAPETRWLQLDCLSTGYVPYTGHNVGEVEELFLTSKDAELSKITLGEAFKVLNEQGIFDTKIRQGMFTYEFFNEKEKKNQIGHAKYTPAQIVSRFDELILKVLLYKRRGKAYKIESCDKGFKVVFSGSIKEVIVTRTNDKYVSKRSLITWMKEFHRHYRDPEYLVDQIEEFSQEELLTQEDPRFQALGVSKKQQSLVAFKSKLELGQGEIISTLSALHGYIRRRARVEMQTGCGPDAKLTWIDWQKEREARWDEHLRKVDELSEEIKRSLENDLDIR